MKRMKRVVSKAISLIVAFAMIVTLIPALPASAVSSGLQITINGNGNAFAYTFREDASETYYLEYNTGVVGGQPFRETGLSNLEAVAHPDGKIFEGWVAYKKDTAAGKWVQIEGSKCYTSEEILYYPVTATGLMIVAKWVGEDLPDSYKVYTGDIEEDSPTEPQEPTTPDVPKDESNIIESGSCGENLTYTLTDEGVLTVSGTGEMSSNPSWARKTIKKVIIEDGVTSIGYFAFYDCTNLVSVEMADSVKVIGDSAFSYCESLKEVTLSKNLTTMESYAFRLCDSLTNVKLPATLTYIGDQALDSCPELSDIEIPKYVTHIGVQAFECNDKVIKCYKNTYAHEYLLNNDYPFAFIDGIDGDNIISGSINNSNTQATWTINRLTGRMDIEWNGLFPNYNSASDVPWHEYRYYVKDVYISGTLTRIGSDTFNGYTNLESVTIPKGVTSLGSFAFYGCSSLKNIYLPEGLKTINPYAITNCGSLEEIKLPESLVDLTEDNFKECGSLKDLIIPYNVKEIFDMHISGGKITILNQNCHISSLYMFNDSVICGFKGSTAETYAMEHGYVFEALPDSQKPLTECEVNGHKYKITSTVKATTTKNGSLKKKCSVCGKQTTTTIYRPSSVKLSTTKYTYNGSAKKPSVTVKDANGNTISSKYYTVSYAKGRKAVGRYKVTVTFKTRYTGTKTAYFTIVPKAPSSASATLYGYDDVKFSWKKSTGAKGYSVYYKSGSGNYKLLKRTTATSVKKANLSDGIKYTFKVVPYYKSGSTRYDSIASKTASVYTLKKMSTPTVEKYSKTQVRVKWTDIEGQSGYQISKSTSKTGTNIVATYATTSGKSKVFKATKNKKYYYKVRAYKTVSGKKIYGPWSAVKAYTLSDKVEIVTININMDNVDKYFEVKERIEWRKDPFGEVVEFGWGYDVCIKDEYVGRLTGYNFGSGISNDKNNLAIEYAWDNKEFYPVIDYDKKTYQFIESDKPSDEWEDTSRIEECFGGIYKREGSWSIHGNSSTNLLKKEADYGDDFTITRRVNTRFTRAQGTLVLTK